MKHEKKILNIFTKQEKIMILAAFSMFGIMGALLSFYVYLAGLMFLFFSIVPAILFFIKAVNRELGKVYRISIKDNVPRFNIEWWPREEINKLSQDYFWIENGNYVPVIHDSDGTLNSLDPFSKDDSWVTSGSVQRSGVQHGVKFLFTKLKMGVGETLLSLSIFAVLGGFILVLWMMFSRIMEA